MSEEQGWHRAYAGYFFDLDGTLIDTAPDLMAALNFSLEQAGFRHVDEQLTRHWVGHGARVLIEQALQHMDQTANEQAIESALNTFLEYYKAHIAEHSTIYPTVITTLRALRARGAKLAVVTNKRTDLTEPLLAETGMTQWFDLVVCGDTTPVPKPAAEPVIYGLTQLGLNSKEVLFVGDSQTDVLAARAADTAVVCVRDGYNQGIDVASLNPDGIIDEFSELLPS